MAKVDAVYFTKDWQIARGCRIEREVAKSYDIKILDHDFLFENKEELVRNKPIDSESMDNEYKERLSRMFGGVD